jgi:hypothetical protein
MDVTMTRETEISYRSTLAADGKSLAPFRPAAVRSYPMTPIEFGEEISYALQQETDAQAGSVLKPENGTGAVVARCIALEVQGGESRSSGKMMTSWRFKSSELPQSIP